MGKENFLFENTFDETLQENVYFYYKLTENTISCCFQLPIGYKLFKRKNAPVDTKQKKCLLPYGIVQRRRLMLFVWDTQTPFCYPFFPRMHLMKINQCVIREFLF